MGNAGILRGLTMARPPGLAKLKHQRLAIYIPFMLFILLPSLGIVIFTSAYGIIANPWNSGDWGDFWLNFMLQVGIPLMGVTQLGLACAGFLQSHFQSSADIEQALSLREAALTGNVQLAPPATEQPMPLADMPFGKAAWGPLKLPPNAGRDWLQALGVGGCGLGLLLELVIPFSGTDLGATTVLVVSDMAAAFFVAGLLCLLLLWRMSTSVTVLADDWGLTWKRARWWSKTAQIRWDEARAFYTFAYEQKQASLLYWKSYQVFVLEGPHATLAWMSPVRPEEVSRGNLIRLMNMTFPPQTFNNQVLARLDTLDSYALPGAATQDQQRFCQLIAARTHLPLRDLTAAANEVVPAADLPISIKAKKALSDNPDDVAWLRRRPTRKARASRFIILIALTPLVILGLFAGVAWGFQINDSQQYEQMLSQIRAHQPLYHDALSAPDTDWPVRQPDANSSGRYTYSAHTYQLSGDYFMDALAPGTYGNVEVEVTASLTSQNSYGQYSDYGLLLHSDDTDAGITFTIDPSGQWTIGRLSSELQDNSGSYIHDSGAIHQGFGKANTLAVIIRNSEYICYINGQFVGIYRDAGSPIGPVGIYMDSNQSSTAPVGTFTNFSIYPV